MYTKIEELFWKDDKVRTLTDDGKLLMLYLMTCQHRNIIGFYYLPNQYAAFDLSWDLKRFGKGFMELFRNGIVNHDNEKNIVLITNYLKHNPLENPNQVKSAIKCVAGLPLNSLDAQFNCILEGFAKPFMKPLQELFAKRLDKGLPKPVSVAVTGSVSVSVAVTGTGSVADKSQKEKDEHPPYQQIVDEFNSICTSLPKVVQLTQSRKDKIKTRWGEQTFKEQYLTVFNKVQASSFCKGSNKQNWKCTFDFLIDNDKNYIKALEGQYDNTRSNGQSSNMFLDELLRLEAENGQN
jgi:hypothetical protein